MKKYRNEADPKALRSFALNIFKFYVQDFAFDLQKGNHQSMQDFKTFLLLKNHTPLWTLICQIINKDPLLAKKGMFEFILKLEEQHEALPDSVKSREYYRRPK